MQVRLGVIRLVSSSISSLLIILSSPFLKKFPVASKVCFAQPPSVPEQKISHVVPVEQALEDLQGLLEAIDAPAEDGAVTRSGGIRRVKNVTTVSPEVLNPDGTRSEATADVEDLLYIVNFENEAGYAILGADDRLEPVYAVVDEGSLTTEEFRYAVTVTPEQAEADGELVFPLQMVARRHSEASAPEGPEVAASVVLLPI